MQPVDRNASCFAGFYLDLREFSKEFCFQKRASNGYTGTGTFVALTERAT